MTDNKKLRYPTKFLSRIIRELKKPDKIAWLFPNDIPMLTEIKGIVEKAGKFPPHIKKVVIMSSPEHQPQPDDLVEALIYASYNFHKGVEFKSKASERIRTLLQSRPSVTRGEIEKVVWSGKNTEGRISDLLVLFKSKGIEVEEKP